MHFRFWKRLAEAAAVKNAAPRSRYYLAGLTKRPERRAQLEVKQMRNLAAAAVRQANQQTYPFSICARSVAMLMRRSTTFDWDDKIAHHSRRSWPSAASG